MKRTILVLTSVGLFISSIVVTLKWSSIAGLIVNGLGWLTYWFGIKLEKKESEKNEMEKEK